MLQKCNKLKKFFKNNLNIYLIAFIDILIEKNNCLFIGDFYENFNKNHVASSDVYIISGF